MNNLIANTVIENNSSSTNRALAFMHLLAGCYARVHRKITSYIATKYGLSAPSAEDVASAATLYAMKLAVGMPSATEADFFSLSVYKAKLLALDELQRIKRSPIVYGLDGQMMDGEGDTYEFSAMEIQGAMDKLADDRCQDEERARIRAAVAVLPRIFQLAGVSELHQRIFTECYLNHVSPVEVSHRTGKTVNHIYKIVFDVKKALRKFGPRLVEEYLAA